MITPLYCKKLIQEKVPITCGSRNGEMMRFSADKTAIVKALEF